MRNGDESRRGWLYRFAPLGALGGVGAYAVAADASLVALLAGAGAAAAGSRLWRRRHEVPGDSRRGLQERARENVSELSQVARQDRIAAPQMKRLAGLQEEILESWKLMPDDYAPILSEDLHAIVGEIEGAAALAHRRAALRRHLGGLNRRAISRRIKGLEKELAALDPDSELRKPFEDALANRRRELEGYDGILDGIGAINAQLESAESLLSNLRGELLSVDAGLAGGPLAESGRLERLREEVSRFRRSLKEVSRSVDEPLEEGSPKNSGNPKSSKNPTNSGNPKNSTDPTNSMEATRATEAATTRRQSKLTEQVTTK